MYIYIVLVMKYYKLKTVVFYIFATTITSFDLKGGENENEGICSCCNCCKEEEKKEEEKNNENKEDTKDKKKEENKEENNKKKKIKKKGKRKKGKKKFKKLIKTIIDNYNNIIEDNAFQKKLENKPINKRLFIANSSEIYNEIPFLDEKNKMEVFFSYKESVTEKNLPLGNLSLISYCPKNENDEESKILEFEMDPNSTINQVFEHFKNASTWVNEKCLILFIKDQDSNIVSLVPVADFFVIYKENK